MIDSGVDRDVAIENPAIPVDLRDQIRSVLADEDNIVLRPATAITAGDGDREWLHRSDRSQWYYWPRLREYLIGRKGRSRNALRDVEMHTDRILGAMANPHDAEFKVRGLVLGYVQSGKTANYTALIAKSADVGYRLVIVLTGMDNGLRRQTQIRLKRELVGYRDNRPDAVRFPPIGKQWAEFTSEDLDGDFRPGNANQAALQGSQPVLLVVKKNGAVLKRLLNWLGRASDDVRGNLPVLVIDDEADQASVDTRGTYQLEGQPLPADYEEPAVINGLIRSLLNLFKRVAYVAYTATPYANILIPHDTFDLAVKNDLYPKDFIVDLPKANGYFGAEELFGRFQAETQDYADGLDVIREVPPADMQQLSQGQLPPSLAQAIETFVLSGAARSERGDSSQPATMLIHVSRLTLEQDQLSILVRQDYDDLRDEWRYQREKGIKERLEDRWNSDFRPFIQARHIDRDRTFQQIEENIGPFLEAAEVRVINSDTGEVLDYEREPGLKAIAIGGNRLSRGLTLEGLLVSYFARESENYDTLMQMGRWFGFRAGYEDLTRIYTTRDLEQWFADLAFVESQLREDIRIFEEQNLKPDQVGMRIWQHPVMEITSRLKRRFANPVTISQSFSASRPQTFKFPLGDPETLAKLCEENRQATLKLVARLDKSSWNPEGPIWASVSPNIVIDFLSWYQTHPEITGLSLPQIRQYIEKENGEGRLITWTIAIMGLRSRNAALGVVDWACFDNDINQIERTRLGHTDSLGVITSPGDEAVGLAGDELVRMQSKITNEGKERNAAARLARSSKNGLLLIYPISRHSGHDLTTRKPGSNRRALYADPHGPLARDLIAIAMSFPDSGVAQPTQRYLEGTVGWQTT